MQRDVLVAVDQAVLVWAVINILSLWVCAMWLCVICETGVSIQQRACSSVCVLEWVRYLCWSIESCVSNLPWKLIPELTLAGLRVCHTSVDVAWVFSMHIAVPGCGHI